jgi:addiction module RelE/StbE family toxin
MRLRYTADALAHLRSINDFLTDRNPLAARRIAADVRAAAERLREFPHIGRKGDLVGTNEWVVRGSPYLIVYEVDEPNAEIRVLGVFHGAQDWQEKSK